MKRELRLGSEGIGGFSERIPLIVSVAITVFGWFITTLADHFSGQTNLLVTTQALGKKASIVTIQNVSVNKLAEHHVFEANCKGDKACFADPAIRSDAGMVVGKNLSKVGIVQAVPPTGQKLNQACDASDENFLFSVTIPPEGVVKVRLEAPPDAFDLSLFGKTKLPCEIGSLEAVDTHLMEPSVKTLFLKYFLEIFMGSFALLLVVFVFTLANMVRRARHAARR